MVGHIMLKLEEIKELIMFAKENGLLSLKVGEVEATFEPATPPNVLDLKNLLEKPMTEEEEKQLLTWSV